MADLRDTELKKKSYREKVEYEHRKQKSILLFCFDFDDTIVQVNTQDILLQDPEVLRNGKQITNERLAKALTVQRGFKFKAANELAETFKAIYKEGHNIAILSFSVFPLVVKEMLKELLKKAGIPTKELIMDGDTGKGRVYIKVGLPKNVAEYKRQHGKNEYIQNAMGKFAMDFNQAKHRAMVFLIDSDKEVLNMGAKKQFKVIEVDPRDPHYSQHLKTIRVWIDNFDGLNLDNELEKIIHLNKDNVAAE